MEALEKMLDWGGVRKDAVLLVLSAAALLASFAGVAPLGFDMAWGAVLFAGVPIICGAFLALVREHDIRADLLVSLALLASLAIGEIFAAGEIAFIMQLGAFLEEYTVGRARSGIERLVALAPQMAWRVRDGKPEEVRADEVAVGDRLRVLAGEKIPADGRILTGHTAVDEAILTGESMPVDKNPGDEVKSGTLNQFGTFEMVAEKVGEDMALSRLIRLVQQADAGKAKIVRLADRWATWIVVAALVTAALSWLVTGDVLRAVTVLVVFCPCALVLATPTAVMAAIGNAARCGFLVKEGDALERLAAVRVISFDKTGTLTKGMPQVTAVVPLAAGWSEARVLAAAAALEAHSEHPLGRAIVLSQVKRAALEAVGSEDGGEGENLDTSEYAIEILPGEGIVARSAAGSAVAAGNARLLARLGLRLTARGGDGRGRACHRGGARALPARGQARRHRASCRRRQPRSYARRRHQRRTGAQERLRGHRHGQIERRHRRRGGGHRRHAGERRRPAAPLRPRAPHDDDDTSEPRLLARAELPRHRARRHGRDRPCAWCAHPQHGLDPRHHQLGAPAALAACRRKSREAPPAAAREGRKRLGKAVVLRYNEGKLRGDGGERTGAKLLFGQSFRRFLLVFLRKTFLGVRIWHFPLRNGRAAATTSCS